MMSPKRIEQLKRLVVDKRIRGGLEAQLALALKDAVAEIEDLQAKLNLKPAPACTACRNDDHEGACGGPESGCGCATRGHE